MSARKLLRQIAELHGPSVDLIEVMVVVDADDCTRDICAECERDGDHEEHREIRVCNQCGESVDPFSDQVIFVPWPCPTAKLLGLDR